MKFMTEETIQIITLVSTIVAGIFMYFEKKNKKYDDFLERYFIKVLNPYIIKFGDNSEIDTVKFVKKRLRKSIRKDKFYIPRYVSYLVEENDKERLHKVLITDYIENYPNNKNKRWKLANNFAECMGIIGMFMSYLLLSLSLLIVVIFLLELIFEFFSNKSINVISDCIGAILLFTIMFVVSVYTIISINKSETDHYSLKKKQIENHIKAKVKYYDKNSLQYYI